MQSLTVQVNKRIKDEAEPRHAEFSYEFPESVAEATEKYGETVALQLLHDAITLVVQGPARKALESASSNLSTEEYSSIVSSSMANYKIDTKRTRGPSTPKISSYQQMANDLADPEKRDAIIARFRSLGINLELDSKAQDAQSALEDGAQQLEETSKEEEEFSGRRRR